MFQAIPYKLKWYIATKLPPLNVSCALPFGGRVYFNFCKVRIYPGRISAHGTRHEWIILRFYNQFLKPDMTVYDVGANVGTHTAAIGYQVTQGRIVCFEPEAEAARYLKKNHSQK